MDSSPSSSKRTVGEGMTAAAGGGSGSASSSAAAPAAATVVAGGGGSGRGSGSSTPTRESPPPEAPAPAMATPAPAKEEAAEECVMTAQERRDYRRSEAALRARELRTRGRKLAPASRPLGVDRDGRVYMFFRGDSTAVYVGAAPSPLGSAVTPPPLSAATAAEAVVVTSNDVAPKITDSNASLPPAASSAASKGSQAQLAAAKAKVEKSASLGIGAAAGAANPDTAGGVEVAESEEAKEDDKGTAAVAARGGGQEGGQWTVFRGREVQHLANVLLSSPLRSEKRLAKEMETHFRLVLVEESVLASEAAAAAAVAGSQSGRDEEEGDSKSEAMDEETSQSGKGEDGGGGKNGGGSQPMARPRLFQARPVKPPPPPTPWHLEMDCCVRGTKSDQCEVCLGSCVLLATVRKNPNATGSSLGPAPGDYLFSAAFGKRNKVPVSEGGVDGRNRAAVAALVKEAEALTKEGKADIQGLKGSVLKIAEAVPGSAWRGGQWRRVSYPSWRTFVRSAIGPRELMQALLLMEAGISKKWLSKWWNKGWASPAVAMRVVTVQSVAFRTYALDSAILYEGHTSGTHMDVPGLPPKRRGRPKGGPPSSPAPAPAGAVASSATDKPKTRRTFKGVHEDTCSKCSTGGKLIGCSYCPSSFHLQPCLDLAKAPATPWTCPLCKGRNAKQPKSGRTLQSSSSGGGGGGGSSSRQKK